MYNINVLEKIKNLPQSSGVYLMKDQTGTIIYVGKARVLKNRVGQYFKNKQSHFKVAAMVEKIADFDYIITNTEFDALILENNLIKKYQPKYNILLKDSKSFPYIKIDMSEDFPRLEIVRKLKKDKALYFGPYFSGISAGEILKAINLAYPIRSCALKLKNGKTYERACLNYSIGLCSAPCLGIISKEDYQKVIQKVVSFLNGKDNSLYDILSEKMENAASVENFELALEIRDRLGMLKRLKDRTVAALTKEMDMDIFAFVSNEIGGAVTVLIVRGGKMMGAKNYNVSGLGFSEVLSSFIMQYYIQSPKLPKIILIQEEMEGVEVLTEFLNTLGDTQIEVPQKGIKKQLIKQALSNAENFLENSIEHDKKEYAKSLGAVEELKNKLGLKNLPVRMECYDISNTQGTNSVSSMVVFINGKSARNHYRRFRIKTVEGPNDFASMAETLGRRLERLSDSDISFGSRPDLIVIDGGKGQIGAVRGLIKSYNPDIEVISLAEREEEVFVEDSTESVILGRNSFALKLLQAIRDEAHRFAITYHRSIRSKKQTESVLDKVDGLGKVKKQKLLDEFKSIKKIREAEIAEISKLKGFNSSLAQRVKDAVKGTSS